MRDAPRSVSIALILWSGSFASGADSLETRVERVMKTPAYAAGHWGVLVVDAKTGAVVYEKNADSLFCPASVTKLFSTSAALVDLGADYRFKTPVVRAGKIGDDGTLSGDLILVAAGDLALGGRGGTGGTLLFEDNDHTYSGGSMKATLVSADPRAGLDHLAKAVKESGVRTVTGEVIVDDRLFEASPSTGSGPSRVVPIVINDNLIDVVVTPRPGLATLPRSRSSRLRNSSHSSARGRDRCRRGEAVRQGRRPRFAAFRREGRLPVGHRSVVRAYEVEEPASFARTLFIEALRDQG